MRVSPIDSDELDGAAYDPKRRVLIVQFESGSIYEYLDVDRELYDELEAAQPHPWRVVGARVKQHRYRRLA